MTTPGPFITLNRTRRVNVNHILSYRSVFSTQDGEPVSDTFIHMSNGKEYIVIETPEQIDELIREAIRPPNKFREYLGAEALRAVMNPEESQSGMFECVPKDKPGWTIPTESEAKAERESFIYPVPTFRELAEGAGLDADALAEKCMEMSPDPESEAQA